MISSIIHDQSAFGESVRFGEGVQLFSFGVVGWTVMDLVAG